MSQGSRWITVVPFLVLITLSAFSLPAEADHTSFVPGGIIAAVGRNGTTDIVWHHSDGTPNRTLLTISESEGVYVTGATLDPAGNFYVTLEDSSFTISVRKFDRTGTLVNTWTLAPDSCSGIAAAPSSLGAAVDGRGNLYLSGFSVYENNIFLWQFTTTGSVQNCFVISHHLPPPATVNYRSLLMVAADGCTLFITASSGARYSLERFDVCTGNQLPPLYVDAPVGADADITGLSLLPNGEVLVARRHRTFEGATVIDRNIVRLSPLGQVMQVYDLPGEPLDDNNARAWLLGQPSHDENTFWAIESLSSTLYKFDLATGSVLATIAPPGGSIGFGSFAVWSGARKQAQLLDPVKELLTAPNYTQITTAVETLAVKGIKTEGVAADGAAKLVIRYPVPSAGMVEFSLVDENGNAIANPPNAQENGALSALGGGTGADTVSVNTVTTSAGEMAFAVYTAPSNFVRAGSTAEQDKQAFERGAPFVHVKPVFIPTGGSMVEGEKVPIKVKRPLVFLVHGIWSCDQTWNNFAPLVGNAPFPINRADYRDAENGLCTASRDFATVAPLVYLSLQDKIETYKMTSNVAAAQAEVVAHSMGGLVTRTMALDPKFLTDPAYPTFGKGPVRRLITIGSPHQGTRLANYLPGTRCIRGYFEDLGKPVAGGIQDLAVGSAALQRLNSAGQTPFSVHTIVGLASNGQRVGANTALIAYVAAKSLVTSLPFCLPDQFTGIESILLTTQHDIVVPQSSQSGNRVGIGTTPVGGTTHSGPFPSPHELDSAIIGQRVVDLLNSNDATLFSPLP